MFPSSNRLMVSDMRGHGHGFDNGLHFRGTRHRASRQCLSAGEWVAKTTCSGDGRTTSRHHTYEAESNPHPRVFRERHHNIAGTWGQHKRHSPPFGHCWTYACGVDHAGWYVIRETVAGLTR